MIGESQMRFQNKVVIVTGAAQGIGRTIATTYAKHEAKVVLADIDESKGKSTLQEIVTDGGKAMYVQTDVRHLAHIEQLMAKAVETYGTIDILVNNAGVSHWKSPYALDIEEWDHIINTNLRSVFLCSREAAKVMRDHGGGAIVNIASTRAIMSEPHSEAYAASKGGILALTHAFAASLADDHIRVNAISPGWIETGDYDELREIDHAQHFSKRVGKPEDIARACLFLTEAENDFITGANIVIDGGMTKKMIYEP